MIWMIKYLPSPIHPGGSRLRDKVRIVFGTRNILWAIWHHLDHIWKNMNFRPVENFCFLLKLNKLCFLLKEGNMYPIQRFLQFWKKDFQFFQNWKKYDSFRFILTNRHKYNIAFNSRLSNRFVANFLKSFTFVIK